MKSSRSAAALTAKEAAALFADPAWAARFPPLLGVGQVAELCQVPEQTVYGWSSRGVLDPCKVKVGKYRRFFRDRLIQLLSEDKLNGN